MCMEGSSRSACSNLAWTWPGLGLESRLARKFEIGVGNRSNQLREVRIDEQKRLPVLLGNRNRILGFVGLNALDNISNPSMNVLQKLCKLRRLTRTQSVWNHRWILKPLSGGRIDEQIGVHLKIAIALAFDQAAFIDQMRFIKPRSDLLLIAKKQDASTYKNQIAEAKDFQLAVLTVDFGAVGAFQIGQNKVLVVEKYFAMVTADAFVIELNRIAFFAADGNRGG